ncbi:MAG: class I SAM-dependent methyltransferase [Flavobacteriales bacterium]
MKALLKKWINERQRYLLRRWFAELSTIGIRDDLTALARFYKTDKWGRHFYTPHYQHHFAPFRDQPINLLEIGVGGYEHPRHGGHSLRMWKRYFPKGRIISFDLYDKSFLEEPRIRIHQGSQVDLPFLDRVIAECGSPDLIIDDGSHINAHVIATFNHLFPVLKDGGYYVIEDTQTSYWPDHDGDSNDLAKPGTLMNHFKALVDGLNHQEFIRPGYQPSYTDRTIVAMHFYHNLIFIRKGANNEGSNLLVDNGAGSRNRPSHA